MVAAAALALSACGEENPSSPGGADDIPRVAQEGSALEHIHGLGIDSADDRLFIATHNGLFAAAAEQRTPQPVGTNKQDTMGFSVAGPGRFIGSGHPGPGQDAPPSLGLIESRDSGKTWKSISLAGEADFHVLQSVGGKVYGFDATQGRLMVSGDDGRSWQQRTPPANVFGLAIDPDDARRVVVSTEDGVFVSKDEGRGWRPLRGDLAGLLAWPAKDALYVVDGEGQVLVSGDAGAVWKPTGDIGGQPAAFIAHGEDLYVALLDGTVKRSVDGGATWTVRTTA